MLLLLRRYIIPNDSNGILTAGIALCFAWLPVFNTFGLSLMGLPLLCWTFLNIANRRSRWYEWGSIVLFPFYTSLVWGAPPACVLLLLILGYFTIKERQLNNRYLLAFGGLVMLFLVANIPLLQHYLTPGEFVSHRLEYSYLFDKALSLRYSLQETALWFSLGHYHVGVVIFLPILATCLFKWGIVPPDKAEKVLVSLIVAVSLFAGFYNWIVFAAGDFLPILETFKFDRLRILLPFFWLLLFARVLTALMHTTRYTRVYSGLIAAQLLIGMFGNDEFIHNVRQLAGSPVKPNFNTYYASELFGRVEAYIGLPKTQYKVASLGMSPAPAQYNGFYTLDGLQAIYSLEYKKRFRTVIAGELAKDEKLRKYFDNWGNRCYLFSAELGYGDQAFNSPHPNRKLDDLDLDTAAFWQLGGRFIFAGIEIANAQQLGLVFESKFEDRNGFWTIFLYRVPDPGLAKPQPNRQPQEK